MAEKGAGFPDAGQPPLVGELASPQVPPQREGYGVDPGVTPSEAGFSTPDGMPSSQPDQVAPPSGAGDKPPVVDIVDGWKYLNPDFPGDKQPAPTRTRNQVYINGSVVAGGDSSQSSTSGSATSGESTSTPAAPHAATDPGNPASPNQGQQPTDPNQGGQGQGGQGPGRRRRVRNRGGQGQSRTSGSTTPSPTGPNHGQPATPNQGQQPANPNQGTRGSAGYRPRGRGGRGRSGRGSGSGGTPPPATGSASPSSTNPNHGQPGTPNQGQQPANPNQGQQPTNPNQNSGGPAAANRPVAPAEKALRVERRVHKLAKKWAKYEEKQGKLFRRRSLKKAQEKLHDALEEGGMPSLMDVTDVYARVEELRTTEYSKQQLGWLQRVGKKFLVTWPRSVMRTTDKKTKKEVFRKKALITGLAVAGAGLAAAALTVATVGVAPSVLAIGAGLGAAGAGVRARVVENIKVAEENLQPKVAPRVVGKLAVARVRSLNDSINHVMANPTAGGSEAEALSMRLGQNLLGHADVERYNQRRGRTRRILARTALGAVTGAVGAAGGYGIKHAVSMIDIDPGALLDKVDVDKWSPFGGDSAPHAGGPSGGETPPSIASPQVRDGVETILNTDPQGLAKLPGLEGYDIHSVTNAEAAKLYKGDTLWASVQNGANLNNGGTLDGITGGWTRLDKIPGVDIQTWGDVKVVDGKYITTGNTWGGKITVDNLQVFDPNTQKLLTFDGTLTKSEHAMLIDMARNKNVEIFGLDDSAASVTARERTAAIMAEQIKPEQAAESIVDTQAKVVVDEFKGDLAGTNTPIANVDPAVARDVMQGTITDFVEANGSQFVELSNEELNRYLAYKIAEQTYPLSGSEQPWFDPRMIEEMLKLAVEEAEEEASAAR